MCLHLSQTARTSTCTYEPGSSGATANGHAARLEEVLVEFDRGSLAARRVKDVPPLSHGLPPSRAPRRPPRTVGGRRRLDVHVRSVQLNHSLKPFFRSVEPARLRAVRGRQAHSGGRGCPATGREAGRAHWAAGSCPLCCVAYPFRPTAAPRPSPGCRHGDPRGDAAPTITLLTTSGRIALIIARL